MMIPAGGGVIVNSGGGSAHEARARSCSRCCSANSTSRPSLRARRSIGFRATRRRSTYIFRTHSYISDPLCGFEVTTQLAIDLVDGLAGLASPEIAARVPKALPIYIFSGSRDPVGAKLQGLIDVYRAARPQPALRPSYIPKRATRLSTRSTAPRSPPISSHGSMPTSAELRVSPSIARGRRRCRPCPSVLRCARPGGGKCRRT